MKPDTRVTPELNAGIGQESLGFPYRCPECLGVLAFHVANFHCSACQMRYPVVDGLPVFSRHRDFYYGEVSKEIMQGVLANARTKGWRAALRDYGDSSRQMNYFRDYCASELRAGFKFLLDNLSTGTALDYGCGPGAISISLARNFAKVYATDLTLERAQFTQIRAEQENLSNVEAFCSGDTRHIPLRSESVDVIIINGVLEWVPERLTGNPRRAQIDFLQELRRILTKDGLLYIGIENRFGFGYLLGKKEEHSRLRFVAPLPRMGADVYSGIVRRKPYRTYTYSSRGYQSLLKEAGFPQIDVWGFAPDYRHVHRAIRLSDQRMKRESLKARTIPKKLRNLVIRTLLPWFAESFGLLAGYRPAYSYVARLVDHISDTYFQAKRKRLGIDQYTVTEDEMAFVHVSNADSRYILKLPLSVGAQNRMNMALHNIEEVVPSGGANLGGYLIPRPVASGTFLGQGFAIEPEIRGVNLKKLIGNDGIKNFYPNIRKYLVFLCKSTRSQAGTWSDILAQDISQQAITLGDLCRQRGASHEHLEQKFLALAGTVEANASDAAGFHCAMHGDFRHANILVDPENHRITGILDWSRFEPRSLPFLDLFSLISKCDRQLTGSSLGESVVRLSEAFGPNTPDTQVIREYAAEIGVHRHLLARFLIVYWIRECCDLLRNESPQSKISIDRDIVQPLQYFEKLFQTKRD
jgi:SAM-dependent methyltransferase